MCSKQTQGYNAYPYLSEIYDLLISLTNPSKPLKSKELDEQLAQWQNITVKLLAFNPSGIYLRSSTPNSNSYICDTPKKLSALVQGMHDDKIGETAFMDASYRVNFFHFLYDVMTVGILLNQGPKKMGVTSAAITRMTQLAIRQNPLKSMLEAHEDLELAMHFYCLKTLTQSVAQEYREIDLDNIHLAGFYHDLRVIFSHNEAMSAVIADRLITKLLLNLKALFQKIMILPESERISSGFYQALPVKQAEVLKLAEIYISPAAKKNMEQCFKTSMELITGTKVSSKHPLIAYSASAPLLTTTSPSPSKKTEAKEKENIKPTSSINSKEMADSVAAKSEPEFASADEMADSVAVKAKRVQGEQPSILGRIFRERTQSPRHVVTSTPLLPTIAESSLEVSLS